MQLGPNFFQPVDPNDPAWANCKAGSMAINVKGTFSATPIDFDVVDCNGVISTVSANSGVVIQGATAPIPVCIQGERDFAEVYKCDVNTGNTILIRTVLDYDTNSYITTYYDLVAGAAWAGNPTTDLAECDSNQLESDAVLGCDGGVSVTQWVVKDNGQPTGTVYYTDSITGAVVTPVAWAPGACNTQEWEESKDCYQTVTTEVNDIIFTDIGASSTYVGTSVDGTTFTVTSPTEQPIFEDPTTLLSSVIGSGGLTGTFNTTFNPAGSYGTVTNYQLLLPELDNNVFCTEGIQATFNGAVTLTGVTETSPGVYDPNAGQGNAQIQVDGLSTTQTFDFNRTSNNCRFRIRAQVTVQVTSPVTKYYSEADPTVVMYLDQNGAVVNPIDVQKVDCSTSSQELIVPHVNGCIEKVVPGAPVATCSSVLTTLNISLGDFIGATKIADDGNGNYTIVQECANSTVKNNLLNLLNTLTLANSRMFEDVGPGFAQFYFGNQNVTNVVDLSLTEVQYDLHIEPGVSDVPTPLPSPCSDPIVDQQYIDSAAFLKSIFDTYLLNVQQPNDTPVLFEVLNYSVVNTPGEDIITHTPAKQFVKQLANGTYEEKYYVQGDINTEIVFNNATDVFKNNCDSVADDGDIVTCTQASENNVVSEGLDTNLNAIGAVIGQPTPTIFHTQLNNTLTLGGSGTSGVMSSGINVNIASPVYTGAQFTFNINVVNDFDPGDPADFGIMVWDNIAGTSVTATSITSTAPFGFDPQGTGLNYPIYGYPSVGVHTVVWTGDLPTGDYTVGFFNQDLSPVDVVEVSIDHNIIASVGSETKARLVALDQCTIDALTPVPAVPPIEVAGGAIITNSANLSVISGASSVVSFAVKPLNGLTYDISFDNGATWLTNIDGTDSYGEGTIELMNISQVVVTPTVSGDRVYIHWETI